MSLIGSSELSQLGIALRTRILSNDRVDQALAHEDDLDEFYHLFGHECCYAQIWSRELLAPSTRSLVTVAMLAVQGPLSETLGVHIRGALRNGCTRAELRQVLAMVTWYAGVPVGSAATKTVRAALAKAPEAQASATLRKSVCLDGVDLVARGRELRLRLLGPQASEQSKAASGAHETYLRMRDGHYFGVLWSNEDLSLKQRCLVLLGVIFGASRYDDLKTWLRAAIRVECSAEELEEVLLTASAYCGALSYERARETLLEVLAES